MSSSSPQIELSKENFRSHEVVPGGTTVGVVQDRIVCRMPEEQSDDGQDREDSGRLDWNDQSNGRR